MAVDFDIVVQDASSVSDICRFLADMDEFFVPRIDSQVSYADFANKLIEYGYLLAAVCESTIVGLVGFYCNDNNKGAAYISYLAVDSAFQGKGIAKALLGRALYLSKENGMTTCMVKTNNENSTSISLYKAIGFEVSKTYFERGRMTVLLSIDLTR